MGIISLCYLTLNSEVSILRDLKIWSDISDFKVKLWEKKRMIRNFRTEDVRDLERHLQAKSFRMTPNSFTLWQDQGDMAITKFRFFSDTLRFFLQLTPRQVQVSWSR